MRLQQMVALTALLALGFGLAGCGATASQNAPATKRGATQGAEAKHIGPFNTRVGRGDCGVPVVQGHRMLMPYGANALGLDPKLAVVSMRTGRPLRVVVSPVDADDPRTKVRCVTLGPGRPWVVVHSAAWPK